MYNVRTDYQELHDLYQSVHTYLLFQIHFVSLVVNYLNALLVPMCKFNVLFRQRSFNHIIAKTKETLTLFIYLILLIIAQQDNNNLINERAMEVSN